MAAYRPTVTDSSKTWECGEVKAIRRITVLSGTSQTVDAIRIIDKHLSKENICWDGTLAEFTTYLDSLNQIAKAIENENIKVARE